MSILVKYLFLLVFTFPCVALAEAPNKAYSITPIEAFNKGKLLRAQFKYKEALEYLAFAANSGESKAEYLYGVTLLTYKPSSRTMLTAKNYLLRAAKQGHRAAMMTLIQTDGLIERASQFEWQQKYQAELKDLLKFDSAQANFELYQLYAYLGKVDEADDYLEKALEAKQPQAMYVKAEQISSGKGFYVFESSRLNDANSLLEESAKLGYIPSYRQLIKNYEQNGDYDIAFKWREKLLQQGDLISLASMGAILTGSSDGHYQNYQDLSLGLGYLSLYLSYAGDDRMAHLHDRVNRLYQEKLSSLDAEVLKKHETLSSYELDSVQFYYFDLYGAYSTEASIALN